jgi:hypothetical protein
VSLQTLHYHDQTAKKTLEDEGRRVSQHEEGLIVDLIYGDSSQYEPVARPVERKAEEEDSQVKQLVKTKGSFSAGALWAVCGTRIGNASVVLSAQKEQLALEAKKTKMERRAKKLFVNARQALQKYESSPVTMTDKDWIDVIQWVLSESNADGLLRDL